VCLVDVSDAAVIEMVPGDADANGIANISDAVFLVAYIFGGGDAPKYFAASDVTQDCMVNISDATALIHFVFGGDNHQLQLGCQHQEYSSGCLTYLDKRTGESQAASADSGYLYLEVWGNDLHIYHIGAFYQCCLGYAVDYDIQGFDITATESDTGDLCDCYCDFDLESVLYDLEDGEYIVRLIGIDGDTVGVQSIVVSDGAGLIGFNSNGCLDLAAASGNDTPDIEYNYSSGTLSFVHHNAYFNCTARFLVDFTQAGDTLRFYELNVSDQFVYCLCYFEITAQVGGLAPGTYVAEVYEHQYPWDDINLVDQRVIVLE
jgi:hypothetical protein